MAECGKDRFKGRGALTDPLLMHLEQQKSRIELYSYTEYTLCMSKTKRIQVPLSEEDEKLIRSIAKLYKISVAEWMRRIALKAAQRDRNLASEKLTPEEALKAISKFNLPITSVKKMTRESVLGRLED